MLLWKIMGVHWCYILTIFIMGKGDNRKSSREKKKPKQKKDKK